MEVAWKWHGSGMEVAWKWNGKWFQAQDPIFRATSISTSIPLPSALTSALTSALQFHFHLHLHLHFHGTSTHFHDTSIGRISMTFPMEKRGKFPRHFQWKSHGKSLSMEATLMVMASNFHEEVEISNGKMSDLPYKSS
jgi:hypothetical protein